MLRQVICGALATIGAGAQAADKILYQPVPDWVKPAPAIDPAKITDASPVLLLLDNQQRLQDGQVWMYADSATRIASSEVLGQAGTVSLPWQPDAGDLIIHRAEIIRGAERIDLLKSGKGFSVIRREQKLEQRQLDGMLTATMPVEGLSVGDILHLTISVTRKDAVLKGDMQGFAMLPALPLRVDFARARMLWPVATKVNWRTYLDGAKPVETTLGGYHDITFALPVAKQPDIPGDAPPRYRKLPVLEASSFAGWAEVSRVMAPLYVTTGLIAPGSPLAAEVARIEAAETDPLKRAALALRLVQEKVRYLFSGLDQGNYVPQTPAQTWAMRYGDCKAKTVLLLALLRAMDVEAEPVLANIRLGDLVPTRLPTPGAFDHVLVKATIAGETLWLDGTDNGARLADIHDAPNLGNVLPVRAAGAALMPVPLRVHGRFDIDALVEIDESAGISLPAPMTATITLRGALAQQVNAARAQASKEDLDKFANSLTERFVGSGTLVERKLAYDDVTGTATVTVAGIAYPTWTRSDERYHSQLDRTVSDIKFEPDRARAAWQAIPVATGDPYHLHYRTRVKLPDGGNGYALDGDRTLAETLGGVAIKRITTLDKGWVTVDDVSYTDGAEIPAAGIAAIRQRLAQAQGKLLTIDAPADVPPLYAQIEATKRAHGFDKTLALYDRGVADQPEEAGSYTQRAWFQERIFEVRRAIADLDRAIAITPDVATYRWRARLHDEIGARDEALADLVAAQKLDPSADDTVWQLAMLQVDRGEKDSALAMVQERIDGGGKGKSQMISLKAMVLGRAGDRDAAMTAIDQAVAASPGNAGLLNNRCWLKGTLNVALDTALKDCTRSIELSDSTTAALDSRALVYFRMNRLDDAMADLTAALDTSPEQASSLYMRGVIRGRQGNAGAKTDLAAARAFSPRIDDDYKRYGIMP